MRVLVTGATGFLGRHLLRALRDQGHDAVAAVRDASRASLDGEVVELDVTDASSTAGTFEATRPEVVIHAAAYGALSSEHDAARMAAVNVLGTLHVYQSALRAQIARFVHLGTAFEHGPSDDALTEGSPLQPRGTYAASKAGAALLLREAARGQALQPLLLRLFNAFGPGDSEPRLGAAVLRGALTRTPIELTAGDQRRDFSYAPDVARRVVALATAPAPHFPAGDVLHVASGTPRTVADFARALAAELGAAELLRIGAAAPRAGEPRHLWTRAERFHAWCRAAGRDDLLEATPLSVAATAMRDAATLGAKAGARAAAG